MPTFWTRTLIPTLRQVPAEAEVPSHQLMLRAGYIRKLAAGVYDYLPLGWRSLNKAMAIVRQEMNAAGANEVMLPVLQPIELWERTGRRRDYGENLFIVQDRHGRHQALGPTHEEVITELVSAYIESYRDLPLNLYQIQTKFRDEFRPRFGVLRSREFQMKDAYSFHLSLKGDGGLDIEYQNMYATYCRIFEACGLPYEVVQAESGEMGGSGSHQFTVLTPTGEDTIFKSDKGNYAANLEKCEVGPRPHNFEGKATGELEEISTPNCPGIEDVCHFFKNKLGSKLKTRSILKSLVYVATRSSDRSDERTAKDTYYLLAIVRGDHDVNEEKLRACASELLGETAHIRLAPEDLAQADGWALGFVGPHAFNGREDTYLVVDPDAAQVSFWVTGANEVNHHVKHFTWKREVPQITKHDRIKVADIRDAIEGDPSPKNDGGVLNASRGIEVGQVFKLGTKYSNTLDAAVLDNQNQRKPIIMGCYGIGINRILAAAIECKGGHDEQGIIWPAALAPYEVLVTPIKFDGQIQQVAEQLAAQIERATPNQNYGPRFNVLIDDRPERPGVKFADGDLIGIPLRITIGEKGLKEGRVELKTRNGETSEPVPVDQAADRCVELLRNL